MTLPILHLASKSTATTYRFLVKDENGEHRSGWACCTVNDATGELGITSDWGNWSHRWNVAHLGRGSSGDVVSLTYFLSDRTSYDYLAGKLCNRDEERVFDGEGTLAALRERLRETRKEWKNGGEVALNLKNRRAREERRYWDVHDDEGLDKETANRLWDEDFPSLCRSAEGYGSARSAADFFVEQFFKINGAKCVDEEPWNLVCTRPSHVYEILKDAILPALSAACGEEHRARTAPRSCTCVGSCKGAAGLAPGWKCALEKTAPAPAEVAP